MCKKSGSPENFQTGGRANLSKLNFVSCYFSSTLGPKHSVAHL